MADTQRGRLAGKIALVTGGASGFGAGIVRRFSGEGAQVAIVDRNLDGAKALAAQLENATLALHADVTSDEHVGEITRAILQRWGRIDIVVNNAGVGLAPQALEECSEADFERLFLVNTKSIYLTARHVVPQMKRAGGGVIVNIASTGAVRPRPNLTWYNASKGWVVAATRSMAIELASFGIRVNAVNPVAGDTPLLATFMGEDTAASRAKMVASIPLGRLATPADIAGATTYLCSDDASMVTGVAIEVDGGRCI